MPLLRAEWWEAHQPLVVFMWIILLVVPFAIVYGAGDTFETVLECIVNDYLTFIVLLFVFYHLDKKAYRKDIAEGRKPDISRPGTEFYIEGLHNIILLAAFLSFKTTDSSIRTKNHFTWGAIKEVAVLFIGIFITMQPALMLLKSVGPTLGISEPYQMFWATGALSSFLDNTPTYLVFLTWINRRYYNGSWTNSGESSRGYFLWSCIYGSKHIYRKCIELYGKSDF